MAIMGALEKMLGIFGSGMLQVLDFQRFLPDHAVSCEREMP
jgi:hypothetical protein